MKINLTKIIVLVSAVVIAISACYYFIIFIPSEKLLSRQIECKRIAQEMYDKSVKKQKQDMEETSRELFEFFYYTISRPFYNFSKKMNTCLYKIGFEGGTNNHSRNCSVVDVYTNSKIISYEIPIIMLIQKLA